MSDKKISYFARTFDEIKDECLKFSNKYYPNNNFADSSVGEWVIDLVSAVGDDLAYHIDRTYQNTNINTTNSKSAVFNTARMNGFKIPGAKASVVQVELSCKMPLNTMGVSEPDWKYAPIVKKDTTLSCGQYTFELDDDVNFAEEFNKQGYADRTFVPARDSNGNISAYTVSKLVIARGLERKIYKKVLTSTDIEPFMQIVLPDNNIGNVESVIFKETSNYNSIPKWNDYYIDEEEFQLRNEAINTYRFFETDSLSDEYRFGTETTRSDEEKGTYKIVENYVDYTQDGNIIQRIYKGVWKPLTQKFITEYTDNGYLKLIFGSGVRYEELPSNITEYTKYDMAKLVNNNMLGVLPKEGWTMFVLYNVVNGSNTNFSSGSINTIKNLNAELPPTAVDEVKKALVSKSFKVNNTSNSVAGKDFPSLEEIKWGMRYSTHAQNRAVTLKDYKAKLLDMPPKYGCPFRSALKEENNKVVMSFLGVNPNGKLDSALPQTLVDNAVEYLSHYKQINDYIEIRSGKIYNLYFEVEVYIDKNYTTADVIKEVISCIKNYMDIQKHDMGESIFIGDLQRSVSEIDGLLSIISLDIYNVWSGGYYSNDKCSLPMKGVNPYNVCDNVINTPSIDLGNAKYYCIDLDACEGVLRCDNDAMFEIKNPSTNIAIKVKTL